MQLDSKKETDPCSSKKAPDDDKKPGKEREPEQSTKHLDDKDRKIEELIETAKRVQADFENYKKRVEKDNHSQLLLGKAIVINRLLPVLDTFEQALSHAPDDKGLKLVHQQLISALEVEGLRELKAEGRLDPYRHECLCEESSPKEKGTIIEEIRKGYMLGDQIIRHSLVKVSNGRKTEVEK